MLVTSQQAVIAFPSKCTLSDGGVKPAVSRLFSVGVHLAAPRFTMFHDDPEGLLGRGALFGRNLR